MTSDTKDLFIFAGEPSADLHGAKLLEELKKLRPDLRIFGVGGPLMRKQGLSCVLHMEQFQAFGFTDILLSLPSSIRWFYFLRKLLLKQNPKVALFIDYPVFNLLLQKSLRKKGFSGKLVHYICPTIWAWKKKRKVTMEQNLDLLLSILPFEKQHFSNSPLRVKYVGHPLVSEIHYISTQKQNKVTQIGLFPGSRYKVVQRNLPFLLQSAKRLLQEDPSLEFYLSISQEKFKSWIHKQCEQIDKTLWKKLHLFPSEKNYEYMPSLDLAMATSGTITLELALHQIPTCVVYAIKKLDLFLAKYFFKINLPYYCLVNLIANKKIFPELYGPNLSNEKLFSSIRNFIKNPKATQQCILDCQELRNILGGKKASYETAQSLLNYLE